MARGPHLSELAAEWQALGAKPQHVRRIFLAWAGLAPWEARKGESTAMAAPLQRPASAAATARIRLTQEPVTN